ncbi:ferritin-like domain-containing protein [Maricaulis sp. CAU 1757]
MTTSTLQQTCRDILETADAHEKARRTRALAAAWQGGDISLAPGSDPGLPNRPARPACPELVSPGNVPRRRLTSAAGRTALMHAVGHIEFNAINLAIDLLARFSASPLIQDEQRQAFVADWLKVADDEARHFGMVTERLAELGSWYGALPAHDGMWDSAEATRFSLAGRLAVAPLVLEARGLDVTPPMIERLSKAGDRASAGVLRVIYNEEIAHVATGMRWFTHVCQSEKRVAPDYFQSLVREYFKGPLKPPFNRPARHRAGLAEYFYQSLTETGSSLA